MVDMRRIWTIFILLLLSVPARAGLELYAVHGDHLGTPRMITDKDQRVVWRASHKPFGQAKVDIEDITFHQRFPGQRFDIESRLHYNYFRDYDPSLGRYIQSDPIGLGDGLNTYAYVGGSPLLFSDPFGLKGGQMGKKKKFPYTLERCMQDQALLGLFTDLGIWVVPNAKIASTTATALLKKAGLSAASVANTAFSLTTCVDYPTEAQLCDKN